MKYLQNSLLISEEISNKQNYLTALGNTARVYQAMNDYKMAEVYFKKAIALGQQLEIRYRVSECLSGLADLYLTMDRLNDADAANQKALQIAKEYHISEHLFDCKLLAAKIAFKTIIKKVVPDLFDIHKINNDQLKMAITGGIEPLEQMLAECDPSTFQGQEQQAALYYELWQMYSNPDLPGFENLEGLSREEHRQAALELYQKLVEKTPKFEYKQRIEELSKLE